MAKDDIDKWHKLDSMGHIYALSANNRWSGVFRLSVVLNDSVDVDVLNSAIRLLQGRVSYLSASLQKGFFWHYLQESSDPIWATLDDGYPCTHFVTDDNNRTIRVLYYNCRISLEVFHALTDGGGAFAILITLVKIYLSLLGNTIYDNCGCLDYYNDAYDAYDKYIELSSSGYGYLKPSNKWAYQVNLSVTQDDKYFLTHYRIAQDNIAAIAKRYGSNIGELLTAILAYALYLDKKSTTSNKPIIINNSIDIRRKISSVRTIRNIFACKYIVLSGRSHTISTIISEIRDALKTIDVDYIKRFVNTTSRINRSKIVGVVPRVVKRALLNIAYRWGGEKTATISLSNYGVLAVPKEFANFVDTIESANGVAKIGRVIEASIVTFNNQVVFTFCNKSPNHTIELMLKHLLDTIGLHAVIYSNVPICNKCASIDIDVDKDICANCHNKLVQYPKLAYVDKPISRARHNEAKLSIVGSATTLAILVILIGVAYNMLWIIVAYILPVLYTVVSIYSVICIARDKKNAHMLYNVIIGVIISMACFALMALFIQLGVEINTTILISFGCLVLQIIMTMIAIVLKPFNTELFIQKTFYR